MEIIMPATPTVMCIYCMSIYFILIGMKVTERSVSVWDQMEKKAAYCVSSFYNHSEQRFADFVTTGIGDEKKQSLENSLSSRICQT